MKKLFLSLFALIAMGSSALAGDKPVISVADVQVMPGGTAVASINLLDGKADTYTAMTLYINIPFSAASYVDVNTNIDYEINPLWKGATASEAKVNVDLLGEKITATVPFASANPIPGSSVNDLVKVKIKVKDDASLGSFDITLKECLFEYNLSDKDYADDVTFKVTITDRVVIDEASTELPANQSGANVLVKRTLAKDVWGTICLPFAMTEAQVKNVFGDGVKLAYFNTEDGYTYDGSSISVNFENWDTSWGIQPNYPLIIKPSVDVETFTLDNVDIDANESNAVQTWQKKASTPPFLKTDYAKFIGTLKAGATIPADNLFISDSKFYYSKGTTTIKGFRGYFYLKDFSSTAGAPEIILNVDGETTRIDGLQFVTEDGKFYNLNGVQVENPTKKGVYIQNGKKVVIK